MPDPVPMTFDDFIDDWSGHGQITEAFRSIWDAATAAEREKCARICEATHDPLTAALIRRGDSP